MNVSLWCNRIIRFGFYALFILVPIVLTPWNFELFEYNKMVATYGLTAIIVGAWIIKMIAEGEFRIAKTPLDLPIILFVASQIVSALFSIDPHVSWFGYYSRFNGGVLSILCYMLLYFAFVSNWRDTSKLIKILLTTASIVAIYGVLEHFGVDKNLWVQDVQSRVFSTLGQPNWLAAYVTALIPLTIALALSNSIYYSAMTVLLFVVLLFTRSRSGYVALAAADLLFWTLLWFTNKQKKETKRLGRQGLIAHALFALIIFVNGTYVESIDQWVTFKGLANRFTHSQPAPSVQQPQSGTALESGGTESGTIRKYVWQGAINAWRASTKTYLIGTGTETFAFAFYQYRPTEHNLTSEWDFLYNKAHNEYLNYLATTGLFGLGSYLVIIFVCIYWFLSQKKNRDMIDNALFAGWVSILFTNFFGFSVVVIQLLFFLIPAILYVRRGPSSQAYSIKHAIPPWGVGVTAIAALCILIVLGMYWKADALYATGNRLGRAGQFEQAQQFDTQAISLNPGEPVYHDDLSNVLASLATLAAQEKNATLAATLSRKSLEESNKAVKMSPKNVNFWKTRTKLFYTLSAFDPTLNKAAIQSLETASTLSPQDPKIYYNLAILYGRDGDSSRAISLLTKAKELKRDYRDAYFGLWVFYTELKDTQKAKDILTQYLTTINPNDTDFQERLAKP